MSLKIEWYKWQLFKIEWCKCTTGPGLTPAPVLLEVPQGSYCCLKIEMIKKYEGSKTDLHKLLKKLECNHN